MDVRHGWSRVGWPPPLPNPSPARGEGLCARCGWVRGLDWAAVRPHVRHGRSWVGWQPPSPLTPLPRGERSFVRGAARVRGLDWAAVRRHVRHGWSWVGCRPLSPTPLPRGERGFVRGAARVRGLDRAAVRRHVRHGRSWVGWPPALPNPSPARGEGLCARCGAGSRLGSGCCAAACTARSELGWVAARSPQPLSREGRGALCAVRRGFAAWIGLLCGRVCGTVGAGLGGRPLSPTPLPRGERGFVRGAARVRGLDRAAVRRHVRHGRSWVGWPPPLPNPSPARGEGLCARCGSGSRLGSGCCVAACAARSELGWVAARSPQPLSREGRGALCAVRLGFAAWIGLLCGGMYGTVGAGLGGSPLSPTPLPRGERGFVRGAARVRDLDWAAVRPHVRHGRSWVGWPPALPNPSPARGEGLCARCGSGSWLGSGCCAAGVRGVGSGCRLA